MILKSQLKFASDEQKRKAKRCHSFERQQEVYVIPRDQTKDARIVVFLAEGILCMTADGIYCRANQMGHLCYHVLAGARRKLLNAKRRSTIASKRLRAA
jgi:hypothetical protein